MKIRKNDKGQIEVQLKDKERYSLLYHRIDNGKYEQYIKYLDKEIKLNKRHLAQVKKFIESLEVKDDKRI